MDDASLVPENERSTDVVASLAVTLDGFVCRADGAVDYLDKYPLDEFDFPAWADRVGALVMGRATYLQTIQWGWTWGDRPTLVLTSAANLPVPDGANITFKSQSTAQAIAEFSKCTDKRTWVFGGGQVVTAALKGGVVDTLDLTIVPEAIGEGLRLFAEPWQGVLRPLEAIRFRSGAVRLVYDASPGGLRQGMGR